MAKKVRMDTDVLERMRRSLSRIQTDFAGEDTESPEDRADDIGPSVVVDAARDYGKDCKKNFERQAEDLGKLLNALDPVIQTFHDMDTKLGEALEEEQKQEPRPNGGGVPV